MRWNPVPVATFRTDRLELRQWEIADLDEWAALNTDPEVMRYLGPPLTRESAAVWLGVNRGRLEGRGWGLWALEVHDTGTPDGPRGFAGFVGLNPPPFEAPFTPCVEIGWRLARRFWGYGLATEAAREVLAFAFASPGQEGPGLDLDEVVSFTVPDNRNSRAVMERLGLHHDPADDFDHPALAASDPLRRHVLYRLGREEYRARS